MHPWRGFPDHTLTSRDPLPCEFLYIWFLVSLPAHFTFCCCPCAYVDSPLECKCHEDGGFDCLFAPLESLLLRTGPGINQAFETYLLKWMEEWIKLFTLSEFQFPYLSNGHKNTLECCHEAHTWKWWLWYKLWIQDGEYEDFLGYLIFSGLQGSVR